MLSCYYICHPILQIEKMWSERFGAWISPALCCRSNWASVGGEMSVPGQTDRPVPLRRAGNSSQQGSNPLVQLGMFLSDNETICHHEMNKIAACPSSKTGIKTTLLSGCVSILKKIHSVQNVLQRYFVHVFVLSQWDCSQTPFSCKWSYMARLFFPPLLLSFLICARNLISISFHPAGQCYLLFCFLPIIDSALQNRLQLLAELFFSSGNGENLY